jgi:hypothetical protein
VCFDQDRDGGCCCEVVVRVVSGCKGEICGIGEMKIVGLWLMMLSSCCATKR